MKSKKVIQDRLRAREAEQDAAHWLHLGNLARERGDLAKAERHYQRAQRHHDAMNRYLGNGDEAEEQVAGHCKVRTRGGLS